MLLLLGCCSIVLNIEAHLSERVRESDCLGGHRDLDGEPVRNGCFFYHSNLTQWGKDLELCGHDNDDDGNITSVVATMMTMMTI